MGWTSTDFIDAFYDVAACEPGFVVVGADANGALFRRSQDGTSWQGGPAPCAALRGVACGKGLVVAVGADGCIATTPM